ncbi:unnamed protein product [Plutella xylostella]|uniref:(diamondback moth) hypothetical protein n=1 Tax=Plutella xylostella TaxID=51655 RepID=A0A8S4G718_PLUXY|nr:unnamed protein product [Plutella xylostella]
MSCCEKIPTRYTIGVMIYMCVLVSFTLQVNLSVNIVDMVPVVANGTETVEKETLGWSAYERALVLGVLTSAINCHDLTPNYASTAFGLTNGLASVSGILSPLVVAHFTEQDETNLERWRPVFYIGSGIYVFSAIIFVVFGSTQVQALIE